MVDNTRAPLQATPVYMTQGQGPAYVPKGYEQIALGGTAEGLTPPDGAIFAVIGVSGDIVRYRDDGVAPDDTHGVQVMPNTALPYAGPLDAIQFITTTSGGVLDILYYGVS